MEFKNYKLNELHEHKFRKELLANVSPICDRGLHYRKRFEVFTPEPLKVMDAACIQSQVYGYPLADYGMYSFECELIYKETYKSTWECSYTCDWFSRTMNS
jgi:hypothetical protein